MRIPHCVATFILASKLLSVSLYGQTVSVRLDTPNYPVMKDEWFPVSVTVSNICDHSFPILRATGNAQNMQIFFCARNNDGTPCSSSLYNMPISKYWNYISTSESAIPLREGDSYSWDFAGLFPMEFDSTNIMFHACMLVGADQWVYSATNAFRFVDREISSGTRMCSTAYLGNENLIQVVIFKNELEGIPFLFDNPTGQRICSIATNEVPSFAMNTNAAILTVTLPVSRKNVRYYPRTGRIEEEAMP